jgi:predicted 2-oxoglutarate/Fe(II)-dependent dioxygenase YbiX
MEIYNVEDPKLGIILYREAISDDLNIPDRLEQSLKDSTHEYFKWNTAKVGYNEQMPDYRDCFDLKISPAHWEHLPEELKELQKIYEDTDVVLKKCLADYESRYNFKMEFMESINFVKYNPGQHFSVHTDHGFSYTCTVSSIVYLNDNYEGGELWFPYINLKFKPKKGDVIFFPSTYIFAHGAMAVTDGTKYSAVTMFDYKDNNKEYHQIAAKVSNTEEQDGTKLTKINS